MINAKQAREKSLEKYSLELTQFSFIADEKIKQASSTGDRQCTIKLSNRIYGDIIPELVGHLNEHGYSLVRPTRYVKDDELFFDIEVKW